MKFFWLICQILLIGLVVQGSQWQSAEKNPESRIQNPKSVDLTVAADGSGNVKTVQEAIDKVPAGNKKRFVIFIKPGVYREQIKVPANKPFVSLIGEKGETTKLTFNLSNKDAGSTSASYSVYVGGHDFYAENLTFENSFGTGSQAVAVLTEADRLVFKNCRFLGWQDTLYAKGGRQYFKDCYIEGHVDFIFGQASAVFENCTIHSKGDGYIAAPMRFSGAEPSGLIFINSKLTGENTNKGVYLGRPWRDYGRTVFLNTEMGAHIRPEGWHHWQPEREKTAFFAEYKSRGAGAKTEPRVKWARQLTDDEARAFYPENFLKGTDNWNARKAKFDSRPTAKPDFKLVSWREALNQPKEWYATDEATRIANQVIFFQHDNGGWSKNIDMAQMLTQKERLEILKDKPNPNTTIDNGATTTQLRYLAKVIAAKNIDAHREAFNRGLDFLFAAQYENGGYPQYFPLKKDYSRRITYNDNAMINVLRLMRDVARKKEDYAFVDEARRLKAERAVEKGLEAILKTQVVAGGEKTVWAAQHDEVTLAPAPARKFEPVSLSGKESADIVEFLMSLENPSPQVVKAIQAAIKWFEKSKLTGIKIVEKPDKTAPDGFDRIIVKDPNAQPLWARFYEIETNRPIFTGRDGVVRYNYMEIEVERRSGYAYYTDEPNELLNKKYPKWKASQSLLR